MRSVRDMIAHLKSTRGLMIVAAAISLGAGIVTEPPLNTVFFIVSALLVSAILLLLSFWLSRLHQRVSDLHQAADGGLKESDGHEGHSHDSSVVGTGLPSPAVTIVIPNHNDSPRVGEAISSIIGQTSSDWECVVVDDASTDESLRIIAALANGDDRIRVVRHRVRGGLAACRNTGLRLARGHFIAFLDSDNVLMGTDLEDRLEAVAAPMHARDAIDSRPLVYTDTLRGIGGFNESVRAGAENGERTQPEAGAGVDPPLPPHPDILLVPQHAAHLVEMLQVVAVSYPTATFAILVLEREAGDQGVIAMVPSGVPTYSLNDWALKGASCDLAVVGQVRSWIVEEVALELKARGTTIVEVPDPYSDLKAIAEAHRRTAADPVNGGPTATIRPSIVERWSREEDPDLRVDFEDIRALKDAHRGERAVVIGNGPSLNNLDLTLLASELTFGVNGIFYAADQMGFAPTYYVVEDSAVVEDNLDAIRSYKAGLKLFPSVYRNRIGELENTAYFLMNQSFYAPDSPNFCVPNFAADCTAQVFCGQSVTIINLQLAFHMGFSEIVLIGMDFSYTIPDDAQQSGYHIVSQGPDPNHFHPEYFGRGKVWKQPKLDRVLASYALSKEIYEANGRRIVNATPGGELHLFERVSFEGVFG